MAIKVAVVTGASAGIGLAAAKELVRQGWSVIAIGRNPQRCASAEAELKRVADDGRVTFLRADLSSVKQARALATKIAEITPEVHLLANNAGGITDDLRMTSEGLEENFAGNHVGPWALTEALMPLLKQTAVGSPAGTVRIVNTSSEGSEAVEAIDLDDIQNLKDWNYGIAYCAAKLGNLLHVRAIAPELEADGIVAHAFHPGTVASNFSNHGPQDMQEAIKAMASISNEDGADTLVWLATAEEPGNSSGGYWYERKPREANRLADDSAIVVGYRAATERLIDKAMVRSSGSGDYDEE